jgi:hypothetical protein
MPSAREDYLLRMLQQAAEAIRRVRERLAGGAPATELLPDVRAAEAELLGTQAGLLRMLDARTAAELLADARRMRLWAELLRAEADVHAGAGRPELVPALVQRATVLDAAAEARERRERGPA